MLDQSWSKLNLAEKIEFRPWIPWFMSICYYGFRLQKYSTTFPGERCSQYWEHKFDIQNLTNNQTFCKSVFSLTSLSVQQNILRLAAASGGLVASEPTFLEPSCYHHLTLLLARECFIEFNCCESFKLFITECIYLQRTSCLCVYTYITSCMAW